MILAQNVQSFCPLVVHLTPSPAKSKVESWGVDVGGGGTGHVFRVTRI